MVVEDFAPAKVNLCLHVTGKRPDGYHLLDSLVVFAGVGDRITAAMGKGLGLTITGPMSAGLENAEFERAHQERGHPPAVGSNLVLRAAAIFNRGDRGAMLTLDKHLPIASGIGGGSSDAAATLRALARLWDLALPDPAAVLSLGADVPVCLLGRPARMSGVGEVLGPLPPLPPFWFVLVNPGIAVATPKVFANLARTDGAHLPREIPSFADQAGFLSFLQGTRNDLQAAALGITPEIGQVIRAIEATQDCGLARMSGSGATCFGLYSTKAAADKAARTLGAQYPQWWVRPAQMCQ